MSSLAPSYNRKAKLIAGASTPIIQLDAQFLSQWKARREHMYVPTTKERDLIIDSDTADN